MSWSEMVDVNGFIEEIMNSMGGTEGFFPIYLAPVRKGKGCSEVLVANPKTGHYVWLGGSLADEIMWEILPATKLAIENLRTPEVSSVGSEECSVCLNKLFDKAAVKIVKEMPCYKQRFHGVCIHKWLARHGSCPLCRLQTLVDGILSFEIIEREGGLKAWEIDILFPQVV